MLQWPLTACEYVVSGSLSSPSRGAFHLSLTVLVHYRSRQFFSLGGWSPQLPTGFHVSRGTQDTSTDLARFPYRILTVSDAAFQPLRVTLGLASEVLQPQPGRSQTGLGYLPFRSPLLRESRLISFRRATEMFQFAHCPPLSLCIQQSGIQTSLWMGCPIRILKAHRLDAAPLERFVGLHVLHRPERLGIHLVLFLACSITLRTCDSHCEGSSRFWFASASLLFALGKIEVINLHWFVFSCSSTGWR